ncbi:Ig-like domain-containing protein [Actinacidiphila glaucinigra]|uniref:Ig-like domain (Group 3) n=1 Tax=Actinacidiphila glaucinigra TaxID=235986 RepID=A0A239JCZ0_9ACTN|nr:Ig-like domain-containing protein [Actinacidiphila glaucinigra]SNT03669.1 Ig-like domain (group 3) [Actinacidiphila glaucinigra]
MKITTMRRRLSFVLASAIAAGGIAVAAAGTARAEVIGSMEVAPATGTDLSGISMTTSAPCPEEATNLIVKVRGAGFPAEGQNVVGNSDIAIYPAAPGGGFSVPLMQTMRDYAKDAGFDELKGRYDFTLTCRKAFGADTYGDFTTAIWFTSNTAYQSTPPPTQAATTTTLAATPASPVVQGTAVKLTATVAPAAAGGSVRFLDGATAIGSPVTVSNGTASLTTTALGVGTHALTAAFTPADAAAYKPSASAALPYTVKVKPPVVVTAAKVTGTVKVASKVTCSATFSGATSYAYAWLRDNKVVSGATAKTRGLTSTDYKHKVSCRVTAKNSTGSTAATSPAVTVGVGPALKNTKLPTISGTAKVGKRLTAKAGSWSPSATSYGYEWRRDGKVIRGATHSTYTLTKADRGHRVALRITAKRSAYTNGGATSKSVKVG